MNFFVSSLKLDELYPNLATKTKVHLPSMNMVIKTATKTSFDNFGYGRGFDNHRVHCWAIGITLLSPINSKRCSNVGYPCAVNDYPCCLPYLCNPGSGVCTL